jgi:hypothetical protein
MFLVWCWQKERENERAEEMEYYCDKQRHLICKPYSFVNLHLMAEDLGIKKCWFHKDHYDIPKRRIAEITEKCEVVSPKTIVRMIKGIYVRELDILDDGWRN